ncbi:MAG: DUF1080 domain-containing protein [Pirellulales bacterium]
MPARIPLLCAVLALTLSVGARGAEPAEGEAGFRPLFDGRTLDGWKTADMSYWSVDEGAITAQITPEHPCDVNQYLIWQGGELADFELRLEFRFGGSPGINGGFQFRSRELEDHDVAGYQIDNNHDTDWLVRIYDEHGRHTLAFRGTRTRFDPQGERHEAPIDSAQGPAKFKLDDWHEYGLVCRGNQITLSVNGQLMAEVIDEDPKQQDLKGILALQLHSGPPMTVQFRNIRLKELETKQDR